MITPKQEALWVLRAQCGDREALESLLRSVQPSLQRLLRSLVGVQDADDALQDTLVLVYRKLAGLENPEVFRPWAFRIASRVGFRRLKKQRRVYDEVPAASLDQLPALEESPTSDALREMLRTEAISPASRAVLVLHFQEELPLAAVAAVLDIPLGTVKSRLAYGLAALRREFTK